MESIPAELRESAEMDGAGVLSIFFKIMLPLSKPILACIFMFAAVGQWNSWTDDLYFMNGSDGAKLHCLQLILYQKMSSLSAKSVSAAVGAGASTNTALTVRMAMTVVTVIPIICVYPFVQKFFTKGIMLGAVKG